MAPTQGAMVVRHHPETGERHLDLLKWGLLPYFTKDPINARAETVATSGMFKSAFYRRRKPIEGGKQPTCHRASGRSANGVRRLWEGSRWPGAAEHDLDPAGNATCRSMGVGMRQ
jgi:hypothetical protein